MHAAFRWVRHVFELAGAVQILGSLGVGTVMAAVVAYVSDMPYPERIAVFVGVLLIVAAATLALWRWHSRLASRRRRGRPKQGHPRRVPLNLAHLTALGRELAAGDPSPEEAQRWTFAAADFLTRAFSPRVAEDFLHATTRTGSDGIAERLVVLDRLSMIYRGVPRVGRVGE